MLDTEAELLLASIQPASSVITRANILDHLLARFAFKRNQHRIEPGLYALGNPTPDSPVLVTANYTLSFDALRSALAGVDAYILVLDTQGINVWCAAGKGTFGTDELVHRIDVTGLSGVVNHCMLILPQLGAPGVAAQEVKKRCGFKVEYGPVRAKDLPQYLKDHQATPEMRQVHFSLVDRLVVVPVELVQVLVWLVIAAVVSFFMGGSVVSGGVVAAILAGVVLFPILLPWLPTRDFSSKGLILGVVVALPFAIARFSGHQELSWWMQVALAASFLLALPPITAFLALNFTGSTTFTSKSGVKREMFAYIPIMAGMFLIGILLNVALQAIRLL